MLTIPSDSAIFDKMVGLRWPGARAQVLDDYLAGQKIYGIKFRNGDLFQGPDRDEVCRQADTHANVVKRLTGKYP